MLVGRNNFPGKLKCAPCIVLSLRKVMNVFMWNTLNSLQVFLNSLSGQMAEANHSLWNTKMIFPFPSYDGRDSVFICLLVCLSSNYKNIYFCLKYLKESQFMCFIFRCFHMFLFCLLLFGGFVFCFFNKVKIYEFVP